MAEHKKNVLNFVLLSDIQSLSAFGGLEPGNKPFDSTIRNK